jgi:hypothetical protein
VIDPAKVDPILGINTAATTTITNVVKPSNRLPPRTTATSRLSIRRQRERFTTGGSKFNINYIITHNQHHKHQQPRNVVLPLPAPNNTLG